MRYSEPMQHTSSLKRTLVVVFAIGLIVALGVAYLIAWAWSTPEVSVGLRIVLPLFMLGIMALEVMLMVTLWRKSRLRGRRH